MSLQAFERRATPHSITTSCFGTLTQALVDHGLCQLVAAALSSLCRRQLLYGLLFLDFDANGGHLCELTQMLLCLLNRKIAARRGDENAAVSIGRITISWFAGTTRLGVALLWDRPGICVGSALGRPWRPILLPNLGPKR